MVYVLNLEKKPLMPCARAKARRLLKSKKAKIVKYTPFTIQLLFECENKTQDITLGVDAGSKVVGLSATTKEKELYSSETEIRDDIVRLIATRRQNRRTRRGRLRYREPRFLNRVKSKKKGWLAPSIINKIDTHIKIVEDVHSILPITKIIVETASFDTQKLKNPDISGKEYQEGEQMGFWNTREFVLHRDNHKCQHCKGKKKDKILQVHHLESRKTGGNAPSNLLTLCKTCHNDYHQGRVELKVKKAEGFRHEAFMGIMRWSFYDKLKEQYPDVSMTYGYITKNTRIESDLPKSHRIDARCISGNPLAKPAKEYFYQRKVRCHNRQIHKANILKGGKKRRNQAEYIIKGFRLFDKVEYLGKEYFIFGRRKSGYFDIRRLDGTKVNNGSLYYKHLRLLEERKSIITERRLCDSSTTLKG